MAQVCPRCAGVVIGLKDCYGWYWDCLRCGHHITPPREAHELEVHQQHHKEHKRRIESHPDISVADWLQAELQRRGWSATDLARRMGVSRSSVSRYVSGDARVSEHRLELIQEIFRGDG